MSTTKATLYFLFSTFLWGLTFVFIKEALTTINPDAFIFYRFMLGAFFLILINPFFYKKITKILLKKALVLGSLLFATVLFQTIGLKTVPASTASFITGTAIAYVVLLTAITTKKWPHLRSIIAVMLALTGLGFVTLLSNTHANINVHFLWVVLCAICFAFYIFSAKHLRQPTPIIPLTILQFLIISFFALLLILYHHESFTVPLSTKALSGILYCGIFASGLAFSLQLHAQKVLSAQKASVLFAMEPVFATLAAVIVLHEHLTHFFFTGAGLILLSVVIIP